MKRKRIVIGMVSLVSAIMLSACGSDNEEMNPGESMDTDTSSEKSMDMDHSDMIWIWIILTWTILAQVRFQTI